MIKIATIVQQVTKMMEMLPEQDQILACDLVKKLVLAWDPDFTKSTPEEKMIIKTAEEQFKCGETVGCKEVNWG